MALLQEMEKEKWNRSGLSWPIKMRGSSSAAERNNKMGTYRKQQKKEVVPEYDADLLERISPLGGIDHMETYSRTGTGYKSCLCLGISGSR